MLTLILRYAGGSCAAAGSDWLRRNESGKMPGTDSRRRTGMIDELEALVGHIFVVGGRAINTTPPGALVQLPPKKAQRGRDQDTFFTLVTPAGTVQGQASFYEQLAKLAADLYFRSSGGVTSGVREAMTAVNSHLIEHNEEVGQRFEVNMICVIMRGREIYVARTGSC